MKHKGILYLIPSSLDSGLSIVTITSEALGIIEDLEYFIVENPRSARRFIKKCFPGFDLEKVDIKEFSIKKRPYTVSEYLAPLLEGKDLGILSEAGVPCIADPGSELVRAAHEMRIQVKPLSGPNAILLGLMASGMNGQLFSFHGYLPRDKTLLKKQLRRLEKDLKATGATQIFMEAPYRNNQIIEQAVAVLNDQTRFCIACDLTAETETIISLPIASWRKMKLPDFHKRPAVFLLGHG